MRPKHSFFGRIAVKKKCRLLISIHQRIHTHSDFDSAPGKAFDKSSLHPPPRQAPKPIRLRIPVS